jgi:hypothetical protein
MASSVGLVALVLAGLGPWTCTNVPGRAAPAVGVFCTVTGDFGAVPALEIWAGLRLASGEIG